jgi:hypothetical protein
LEEPFRAIAAGRWVRSKRAACHIQPANRPRNLKPLEGSMAYADLRLCRVVYQRATWRSINPVGLSVFRSDSNSGALTPIQQVLVPTLDPLPFTAIPLRRERNQRSRGRRRPWRPIPSGTRSSLCGRLPRAAAPARSRCWSPRHRGASGTPGERLSTGAGKANYDCLLGSRLRAWTDVVDISRRIRLSGLMNGDKWVEGKIPRGEEGTD